MAHLPVSTALLPSTPDTQAIASLTQIIHSLSTSNTSTIRTAEASLTTPASSPAVVLPLASIACYNPHVPTRHLAAVLLRQAIQTHWYSLPPAAQAALQARLLARLPAEDAPSPQRGLVAAAAAVCHRRPSLCTELMQTAVAMARANLPFVRAGGFKLVDAVADAQSAIFAAHAETVCPFIAHGLHDQVPDVRHAALGAFASCTRAVAFFSSGDEPRKAVAELVPGVVELAHATTVAYLRAGPDADDEEVSLVLCQVFDVQSTLSKCSGVALMEPLFLDLFRFALDIAIPSQMSPAARRGAVESVCSALSTKPEILQEAGLVEVALFEAFRMALMHPPDSDGGEGDTDGSGNTDADEDEDTAAGSFDFSLNIVYTAANRDELAPEVFEKVMRMVLPLMAGDVGPFNLTHPPSSPHHAATVAFRFIGAIAGGCSDQLSAHAKELLTRLASGAVDGATPARTRVYALDAMWRVVACIDFSEVSAVEQETCSEVCFQAILKGLGDPSMFVRRESCIALKPVLETFSTDRQPMSQGLLNFLSAFECFCPSAANQVVSAAALRQ